jgi:hypothetical protein
MCDYDPLLYKPVGYPAKWLRAGSFGQKSLNWMGDSSTICGMATEVLTQLRSVDAPKLPIFVLSTHPDAQDLLREGANAVLIKPVAFADLLVCVAIHIATD